MASSVMPESDRVDVALAATVDLVNEPTVAAVSASGPIRPRRAFHRYDVCETDVPLN
ncbi:hypothetical protein ACI79D_20190 [Geodermatophilus sp. SYSU D00708]